LHIPASPPWNRTHVGAFATPSGRTLLPPLLDNDVGRRGPRSSSARSARRAAALDAVVGGRRVAGAAGTSRNRLVGPTLEAHEIAGAVSVVVAVALALSERKGARGTPVVADPLDGRRAAAGAASAGRRAGRLGAKVGGVAGAEAGAPRRQRRSGAALDAHQARLAVAVVVAVALALAQGERRRRRPVVAHNLGGDLEVATLTVIRALVSLVVGNFLLVGGDPFGSSVVAAAAAAPKEGQGRRPQQRPLRPRRRHEEDEEGQADRGGPTPQQLRADHDHASFCPLKPPCSFFVRWSFRGRREGGGMPRMQAAGCCLPKVLFRD
jgi:hypothetical protein